MSTANAVKERPILFSAPIGQKAIDTWEEEILNWFDKNRPVVE